MMDARVVLLANIVPPYRLQFFRACRRLFRDFTVVRSARTEANRAWGPSELELDDVVDLRCIVIPRTWRVKGLFDEPAFLHIPRDTIRVLRRLAPDVVIAGELGIRTLQAVVYKRMARHHVRLVIHVDVAESTEVGRGRLLHLFRRALLREADAIWVNGRSGARYVRTLVDDPDKRVFSIPYPVPDAFYGSEEPCGAGVERSQSIDQPLRLLFVGRTSRLKNLAGIVSSLDRVLPEFPDHRGVEISVVGADASDLAPITSRAVGDRLRVRPLGFVPYDLLPAVYRQHDALLHPSLADTWGLVVGEALASGLPVIGSIKAQAVEEMVMDGDNGYTFDPFNAPSVDAACRRLLAASPSELSRMAQMARASSEPLRVETIAASLARNLAL